jgi:hypothetical protein
MINDRPLDYPDGGLTSTVSLCTVLRLATVWGWTRRQEGRTPPHNKCTEELSTYCTPACSEGERNRAVLVLYYEITFSLI